MPKFKKIGKTALKFLISGIALYIVFRKVDVDQIGDLLIRLKWGPFVLAVSFFTLSKILSSYRLNSFFRNIGLGLSERYNLRLYWIGMFYNLFLPGGIGGDGYKVYLLNKGYKTGVKPLIAATLLDRVSGLLALLILAGIGFLITAPALNFPDILVILVSLGLILCVPVYWWIIHRFFRTFLATIWVTTIQSLGVQLLQVLAALFILWSLEVSDQYLEYQVLFLISSVVAVFPFTIGGIGAREITFILGYEYFLIDENVSVAFSLVFFLITALVSLVGILFKEEPTSKDLIPQ